MNFLSYKARFTKGTLEIEDAAKLAAYTQCLDDLLTYLKNVTQFDPSKRMIDSVPLLDSITCCNSILQQFKRLFIS